ncbi:peptide chain release factor N(5)-glutamine methyltransferase, partial [Candidatus Parcubacteria bacterium]
MTILEALNWGKKQLEHISSANPMLDAQILLSACLNKPTSYLFANFEEKIPIETTNKYQRFIQRRQRQEPVSHILGKKEFYGRTFYINPHVLTPRPETEILIEQALPFIDQKTAVIDVGTGSGAIAITLAAEKQIPVIAIDISRQALAIAKHNAEKEKVADYIAFLQGDLLQPIFVKKFNFHNKTTIITANLPYIPHKKWLNLDNDVKKYEPKIALVGGVDGLDYYDRLLQQLKNNRHKFDSIII